jgi:hypothetical protein
VIVTLSEVAVSPLPSIRRTAEASVLPMTAEEAAEAVPSGVIDLTV